MDTLAKLLKTAYLLGLFILGGCVPVATLTPTVASPPASRRIENDTLGLVEVWRVTVGTHCSTPVIYGGKITLNYGAEAYPAHGEHDSWLTTYLLENGQIFWQTHLEDPGFNTCYYPPGETYIHANRLYLIYSFQVQAFDLQTGQMLWHTPRLRTHSRYDFGTQDYEQQLLVYTEYYAENLQDEILMLDPNTGEILAKEPKPETDCWTPHASYLINFCGGVTVFDKETNQMLWYRPKHRPEAYQLVQPTYLDEDVISQEGRLLLKIVRLNMLTGNVVWETEEEFISNYIIFEEQVYAFRKDGVLVAFDLNTGQEVEYLQFSAPPSNEEIQTSSYWLGAEDGYIILYMSDHQELIVFTYNSVQLLTPTPFPTTLPVDAQATQSAASGLALVVAAQNSNISEVKTLLATGVELNTIDVNSSLPYSALMWAAYNGDTEIAQLLIVAGADLDLADEYQRTALIHAVQHGHEAIVQLLVDADANLNIAEIGEVFNGYTALHWAILMRHPKIANILVNAGADLEARDAQGATPLMLAAQTRDVEVTELLIDAGADVNVRNTAGFTILNWAQMNENHDVAELLRLAGATE